MGFIILLVSSLFLLFGCGLPRSQEALGDTSRNFPEALSAADYRLSGKTIEVPAVSRKQKETSESALLVASVAMKTAAPVVSGNLVGVWSQPGQRLTVDSSGNWELSGLINSSGYLTVAAAHETTQLVKLYGFNPNIGGIGTYFTIEYHKNGRQLRFGYLGEFELAEAGTEELRYAVYMGAAIREELDYQTEILGTWTLYDKQHDMQLYWNFNPNNSVEVYSGADKLVRKGLYELTRATDEEILLTIHYEGSAAALTTHYRLKNGILTQQGSEWAKLVRNTVPESF